MHKYICIKYICVCCMCHPSPACARMRVSVSVSESVLLCVIDFVGMGVWESFPDMLRVSSSACVCA